jgi:hypothetical protein
MIVIPFVVSERLLQICVGAKTGDSIGGQQKMLPQLAVTR